MLTIEEVNRELRPACRIAVSEHSVPNRKPCELQVRRCPRLLVAVVNLLREHWNVHTRVRLAGQVEIVLLVLREGVEPDPRTVSLPAPSPLSF